MYYGLFFWGISIEVTRMVVFQKWPIGFSGALEYTASCRTHFCKEKILTLASAHILAA